MTRPSDFKRVFTRPAVSADRYFKVLARSGETGVARLGLAVSRQVDKRASARNRLKRITRESFRRHFAGGGPALDIVVLPRRESIGTGSARLRDSLENHWKRLEARTRKPVAEGGSKRSTRGEDTKA